MLATAKERILDYKYLWFNPVQPFLRCVMITETAGIQEI